MSSVALNIIAETQRRNLTKDNKPKTSSTTRIAQKIGKCTIYHESVFKVIWDWFVLALVLYTAIDIPYEVAFYMKARPRKSVWEKINSGQPQEIINLMVDLMFIIDIFINFRTTYLEKEEVVSSPKKIAIHYLKTWFIVDFVAAIPFDYFIPAEAEGVCFLIRKYFLT